MEYVNCFSGETGAIDMLQTLHRLFAHGCKTTGIATFRLPMTDSISVGKQYQEEEEQHHKRNYQQPHRSRALLIVSSSSSNCHKTAGEAIVRGSN